MQMRSIEKKAGSTSFLKRAHLHLLRFQKSWKGNPKKGEFNYRKTTEKFVVRVGSSLRKFVIFENNIFQNSEFFHNQKALEIPYKTVQKLDKNLHFEASYAPFKIRSERVRDRRDNDCLFLWSLQLPSRKLQRSTTRVKMNIFRWFLDSFIRNFEDSSVFHQNPKSQKTFFSKLSVWPGFWSFSRVGPTLSTI